MQHADADGTLLADELPKYRGSGKEECERNDENAAETLHGLSPISRKSPLSR